MDCWVTKQALSSELAGPACTDYLFKLNVFLKELRTEASIINSQRKSIAAILVDFVCQNIIFFFKIALSLDPDI